MTKNVSSKVDLWQFYYLATPMAPIGSWQTALLNQRAQAQQSRSAYRTFVIAINMLQDSVVSVTLTLPS